LADTDDMVVAGEASNGSIALEKVRERDWGLVVLDLSMSGRSGIELIKLIKTEKPKCPVLIFSMHPEEQYAVRALRAGASGYLSKEGDSDLILPALRKVSAGGVYFSAKVAELLVSEATPHAESLPHQRLSDREFQIFEHIVRGMSMTDIANELSLSIKTVSTHKSHIMAKMGMSTQVELVRYAIAHHLMSD
jgi:two-component system invasion response regulator UvrY